MFNVLNYFNVIDGIWILDTKQYLIILSLYEARQKKKSYRDLKETIHWPKLDLNSFCISPLHNWYRRYRNSNADSCFSCHIQFRGSFCSFNFCHFCFLFFLFYRVWFSFQCFPGFFFIVFCLLFTEKIDFLMFNQEIFSQKIK